MPIRPVAGPAGAGKSQHVDRERGPHGIVIDFTALWAALTGATRGPDGKYPERTDDDPSLALVSAVKAFAVSQAITRELTGFVTTSSRTEMARLEVQTGQPAVVIDPGEDVVRGRLTDQRTGVMSEDCAKAMARWYGGGDAQTFDPTAGPRASASIAAELDRRRRGA